MSAARSGTLSAAYSSGLPTPPLWLSSSPTVTASSSRRTARRWRWAGSSRPSRPSAASRSTAVPVTSPVRPGTGNRLPGCSGSDRSGSACPVATVQGARPGSPPARSRAGTPSSARACSATAAIPSGGSPRVRAGGGSFTPGAGDPVAEREAAQAGQPVRRRRVGRRHQPHAGQLDLGLERRLADDDELAAQARLAGLFGQGAGRDRGQETVVEVLAELVLAGCRPARAAGPGEPLGHPEQVSEGRATGGAGLFQPGPAGQAVLAGDGDLGVVQGDELARGQAVFRLEFQVTQARPGGQCPRRLCSR